MIKKYLDNDINRNVLLSAIYKPISILVSFLYVRVAFQYLGEFKYGVWATLLSILSWISYFDIGIGNGMRNRLSEEIGKNGNSSTARKIITSTYAILSLVILVVLVVASVAATQVNWNVLMGVESFDENLSLIVIMCFVGVGINFILSLANNVLYALQKPAVVNLMALILQVVLLVSVKGASYLGAGKLIGQTGIYCFAIIIVGVASNVYLYSRNRELIPRKGDFDWGLGMSTSALGIKFFVIQIVTLLMFTTDNLIISYLFGASSVTVYSTVIKLFSCVASVYVAVITPFWSKLTAEKSSGNINYIRKARNYIISIWAIGVAGVLVVYALYPILARVWLGTDLTYPDGLVLMTAVYTCVSMWCSGYAMITNGMEMMKIAISVAVIQGIVHVPLSFCLGKYTSTGMVGVLVGTILSMLISAVVVPIYVQRVIQSQPGKETPQ